MAKRIGFTLALCLVLWLDPPWTSAQKTTDQQRRTSSGPNTDIRAGADIETGKVDNVENLIEALKDKNRYTGAARALSSTRDPRAVEGLILALNNKNTRVRSGAAYALGQIQDPSSVPALIKALADQELTVRLQATRALGNIRDVRAVDPLILALNRRGWEREDVARSLGKIGSRRSIDALMAAVKHGPQFLREAAVDAVIRIGEPGTEGVLLEALRRHGSGMIALSFVIAVQISGLTAGGSGGRRCR